MHRARRLPGVSRIRGSIVERNRLHIVMDLVRGRTLHDFMTSVPDCIMSPAALQRLVAQLSCTLRKLHGVGVLHRDLKPANIIIDHITGAARLIDFGLAVEHFEDESPDRGSSAKQGVIWH